MDVLGYESSAGMGVAVFLVISFGRTKQQSSTLLTVWSQTLTLWIELIPAFAVLCLNAFRVQNCDWSSGLGFWFLIPMCSCFHIVMIRQISNVISERHSRIITLFIVFCEFAYFLFKLAYWPSIQGFSLAFGWFAGSIYDEALGVPNPLIYSRITEVLSLTSALLSIFALGQFRKSAFRREWLGFFFVISTLGLLLIVNAGPLGVRNTPTFVQSTLGGVLKTEHFTVYYSPRQIPQRDRGKLQRDLEYRYFELQEYFNEDPVLWKGRPIEVFIYPDKESQQKLMGSRRTLVARPWTHQMHIRWTPGSSVVAHELAHLFTAPFGIFPLKLSGLVGILPNLGFIEGIAVAADWDLDSATPDEVSASLLRHERLPDLSKVFSPWGFWRQSSDGFFCSLVGNGIFYWKIQEGISKT